MSMLGLASGLLVGGAVAGLSVPSPAPRRFAELRAVGGERSDRSRPSVARDDPRRAARLRLLAAVAVGGCWFVHPMLATAVVGVVSAAGPMRAARHRRQHEADVRRVVPDVIDLFRSSVDAGLTIGGAIDAVAPRTDGAWRGALAEVQRRVALGERRAVALRELDVLGDAARPLTRALIASERDGAPLVVALDALARDARLERRRDAEEQARRLPVQMLFPLVLCILPAFCVLTVVPLLAGTLQSLTG